MQWHSMFADVIVTIHLGIVSFVLFGLILTLLGFFFRWQWVRNFWFRLAHLATIAIVVFESLSGIECPFTTWERTLRMKAGQEVSEASFVGQLMHSVLFYDAPESIFTVCYCIFGALVLATFLFAPPRWPWRRKPAPASAVAGPHAVRSSEPLPRRGLRGQHQSRGWRHRRVDGDERLNDHPTGFVAAVKQLQRTDRPGSIDSSYEVRN